MIVKVNGRVIDQASTVTPTDACELKQALKPISEDEFKASWKTYAGALPCVAAGAFYELDLTKEAVSSIPAINFNPKDMLWSLANFIRGAYHFVFSLPNRDTFAFYLQDSFGIVPQASIYQNYYAFKSVVYANLGGLMGAVIVIGGVAIIVKYMYLAYTGGGLEGEDIKK